MDHELYFMKLKNNPNNIEYNTWTDWGLIPTSRPTLVQPSPVYKYVDIPGKDGPRDLTDYLIGRPTYSDRKGSFEFYVDTAFYLDGTTNDWIAKRNRLAEYFDGTKMRLRLKDDPDYCYYGRFFFKDYKPGDTYSSVTIEYEIEPYRRKVSNNTEAGL